MGYNYYLLSQIVPFIYLFLIFICLILFDHLSKQFLKLAGLHVQPNKNKKQKQAVITRKFQHNKRKMRPYLYHYTVKCVSLQLKVL